MCRLPSTVWLYYCNHVVNTHWNSLLNTQCHAYYTCTPCVYSHQHSGELAPNPTFVTSTPPWAKPEMQTNTSPAPHNFILPWDLPTSWQTQNPPPTNNQTQHRLSHNRKFNCKLPADYLIPKPTTNEWIILKLHSSDRLWCSTAQMNDEWAATIVNKWMTSKQLHSHHHKQQVRHSLATTTSEAMNNNEIWNPRSAVVSRSHLWHDYDETNSLRSHSIQAADNRCVDYQVQCSRTTVIT